MLPCCGEEVEEDCESAGGEASLVTDARLTNVVAGAGWWWWPLLLLILSAAAAMAGAA